VVTWNVFVVVAAATVTLAGTLHAAVGAQLNVTTTPPAGAADASVTVPVDGLPPTTVVGDSETEESAVFGLTVSVAVFVTLE
jgi:hypothetical protein